MLELITLQTTSGLICDEPAWTAMWVGSNYIICHRYSTDMTETVRNPQNWRISALHFLYANLKED
jgi:hypothetical protein